MELRVNGKIPGVVKRLFVLSFTSATLTVLLEMDLRANAQTKLSQSQRQELKKRTKKLPKYNWRSREELTQQTREPIQTSRSQDAQNHAKRTETS